MGQDPLLACIEGAIEATRRRRGVEDAVRRCLALIGAEAARFRDGYLRLCHTALLEALRAPPAVRQTEIVSALEMCRRTIVMGTP
jgi:hypothetical protein